MTPSGRRYLRLGNCLMPVISLRGSLVTLMWSAWERRYIEAVCRFKENAGEVWAQVTKQWGLRAASCHSWPSPKVVDCARPLHHRTISPVVDMGVILAFGRRAVVYLDPYGRIAIKPNIQVIEVYPLSLLRSFFAPGHTACCGIMRGSGLGASSYMRRNKRLCEPIYRHSKPSP